MKGASMRPLLKRSNCSSNYWRTPPVVIVYVAVPDVPTVTGVAMNVYPPVLNVQV